MTARADAQARRGTSLASYRQSVHATSRDKADTERCPRKVGWRLRNTETGEVRPARCGANVCSWCLPRNALQRGRAIAYAAPERAILLTDVGDDWQQVRGRMKRLRLDLRQELGAVEWVWHVEPNPRDTGHHVHAWQHGDFMPQKALARLASRRGMGGVVFINRVRHAGSAGQYGLKLAGLDYGMKAARELDEQARVYLAANGRRLHHASRGYWRDPQGRPISGGVKAAVRAACGSGSGSWIFEPEPLSSAGPQGA